MMRVHGVFMTRHVMETFHTEALEFVSSYFCRSLGLVHPSDDLGEDPAKYIGTFSIRSAGRRVYCLDRV